MDFKLILTVFITIFVSELGDKTQLAVLGFSATRGSWLSVFLGGALALILATFMAAFLGTVIKKFIPMEYLHYLGGALFVLIGFWMIFKG